MKICIPSQEATIQSESTKLTTIPCSGEFTIKLHLPEGYVHGENGSALNTLIVFENFMKGPPHTLSIPAQFTKCDVVSEQLTEDTAQFSQVFTQDTGLCKNFYISPINCAVSSVNRSDKSVQIKYQTRSYFTHPLFLCPSLRVINLSELSVLPCTFL